MNNNFQKKLTTSFLFIFFIAISQAMALPFSHNGSVNQIVPISENQFYSCSSDGSIIFYDGEVTEYFQVSELPIKNMVYSPNADLIAIYETDDFSINRVSVWDWKNKKRLFAKRFLDSVLTISFSATGKYLMVATHSVGSLTFFDAKTGEQQQLLDDTSSLVSLVATGGTDKTVVSYSQLGSIEYSDLTNGKQKMKFSTEQNLNNSILHKNNVLLTGFSNGTAYTIDMTTGKSKKASRMFPENTIFSSFIFAEKKSEEPLFFIQDNKDIVVKDYSSELARFSKPKNQKITALTGFKIDSFVFGTEDGSIYKLDSSFEPSMICESRKTTISSITTKTEESISYCYFISSENIFRTPDPLSEPELVYSSIKADSILGTEKGLLAWTKEKNAPVYFIKEETGKVEENNVRNFSAEVLFSPNADISSLNCFENKVVCIESNSKISVIDIETHNVIFSYSGAGFQNAILDISSGYLYISKTASFHPMTSLLRVSINNGEVVPVSNEYSMLFSTILKDEYLYSLALKTENSETETSLIRINLFDSSIKVLAKYPDENTKCFLKIFDDVIYTDLGRTVLLAYSLNKNTKKEVERNESLAKNVESTGDFIQVLRENGTISWYSAKSLNVIATLEKIEEKWIIKRID